MSGEGRAGGGGGVLIALNDYQIGFLARGPRAHQCAELVLGFFCLFAGQPALPGRLDPDVISPVRPGADEQPRIPFLGIRLVSLMVGSFLGRRIFTTW